MMKQMCDVDALPKGIIIHSWSTSYGRLARKDSFAHILVVRRGSAGLSIHGRLVGIGTQTREEGQLLQKMGFTQRAP